MTVSRLRGIPFESINRYMTETTLVIAEKLGVSGAKLPLVRISEYAQFEVERRSADPRKYWIWENNYDSWVSKKLLIPPVFISARIDDGSIRKAAVRTTMEVLRFGGNVNEVDKIVAIRTTDVKEREQEIEKYETPWVSNHNTIGPSDSGSHNSSTGFHTIHSRYFRD